VTGAGNGIGAATARLAAREGARVVVNDIVAEAAQRVVADVRSDGGVAEAHVGDIANWKIAQGLVQACVDAWGTIDGLVNNAALHHLASIEEEKEAEAARLIEVNVLGTMYCGLAALREMRKRGRGSLVNTTSGAQSGITLSATYSASKGAVASMTYAWAIDCAGSGVRVNALSPMAGDSINGYSSRMPLNTIRYCVERGLPPWPKPNASPEDNAPVTCFLLSDLASGVNGQVVRIDGKRLTLMTHPAAIHPLLERSDWTVAEVADAFNLDLSKRQQPLGVVLSADATLLPYAVSYPREQHGLTRTKSGEGIRGPGSTRRRKRQ
jgi:NAD(P)-dependent dehydrogenase (short-subunit alcohol dehydrogenase family)